jgi:hypothetical protein
MYRLPISSRIRIPSSTEIHGLLNGAEAYGYNHSIQASKAFCGIPDVLVESLAQGFPTYQAYHFVEAMIISHDISQT